MDFFEVIDKRRSVRRFSSEAVPDEVINKAISAAIKAPNSSNLQPWEFYWVKSETKKAQLVEACFSQGAARTAQHLVAIVSRIDSWKRHRDYLAQQFESSGQFPKDLRDYYFKVIPVFYRQDPFGILGLLKWVMFTVTGFFRPIMRGPLFRRDLFENVTKTTALACENFMLSITAQGYASCPMEGFDEHRVKKILGLGCSAHVVMVVGVGRQHESFVTGEQFRVNRDWVVHEV